MKTLRTMQIAKLKSDNIAQIITNDNKKIMLKKNEGKATPTILSNDLEIQGDLVSQGLIEIEGKVKGVIKGNSVIIREDGLVEGEIISQSLNIRGKFQGNIKAKNISISSKATVNGNIEYNTLCVEDGASIDGQFKKIEENN